MTVGPTLAARWHAWLGVLHEAGYPARPMTRPPAGPEAVALAERESGVVFPEELRALYLLCDGQYPSYPRGAGPHPPSTTLLPAHDLLGVDEALVQWRGWADIHRQYGPDMTDFDDAVTVRGTDPVRRVYWDLGWWPLGMDGGGNVLAVDTAPAPGGTVGQVIVAGPDEDERRLVGTGVGDYLDRLCAAGVPAARYPHPEDPDPDPDRMVYGWDVPTLR